MPQTMLTVKGQPRANPDYLPEKTMEGRRHPALQTPGGGLREPPREDRGRRLDGQPARAVKTTVQLFGNAADTVRHIDMRQGDPSSPAAASPEPAAYASSRTASPARNVINAQWLVYDSILYQRRKERAAEAEQQAGSSPSETQPATGEERP